ncbi:MAG TPA: hypothetical protein VE673_00090 [Pseudonocardiaceae bacterium]|nr:hypothetical protein [Pseudonocardiaceae bacterium]
MEVRKVGHAVASVVVTAVLTGMLALINPVPAAAHIVGAGGTPTDYRTTVTAIRPAVPTVGVTVGLGGQWVRVTNHGAAAIVVRGYQGEPFLRLSGNQVQVNELSATAAETVQTQRAGASAGPTAAPRWTRLQTGTSATWTDARISAPPTSSTAATPWTLPLVVDGEQVTVDGTIQRIPPPSPWPWLVLLALVCIAVGATGWTRNWHRPIAAAIGAGILAFVAHVLGTGFATQQSGSLFGWVGVGLVAGFSLLIGAVAVRSTLRRSPSAPDRLVTVGAIVLVLAATDITVLWNSQLPFAGPAALDRGLTTLAYASALGLIVAGVRLVRVARAEDARAE